MATLTAALPFTSLASDLPVAGKRAFSFLVLGDLHFDKFEHHDVQYMREKYPNDIRQVINYSHITWENLPDLMRATKAMAQQTNAAFILQLGDFLEGLCGSKELAATQATEFIRFVADQKFHIPFVVTKGNHDITGTGAREVYAETVLPWQARELQQPVTSASFTFVRNDARFVVFDGYEAAESLEWFKTVLKDHKEKHLFFSVHEPVVPYNARSTWHLFSKDSERRQELLNLLGKHRAFVLGGHLHKTSIVVRNTPQGNFVQVAIGSVVPALNAPVKNHIQGVEKYNGSLVSLEPEFSPSNLQQRKDILERESRHIRHFEYADFCGYGAIQVKENNEVELSVFANADQAPWTTVNLSKLLRAR